MTPDPRVARARKLSFDLWLKEVDEHVQARTGLSRDDMPDIAYRDLFDGGATPRQAASAAIRNAKE